MNPVEGLKVWWKNNTEKEVGEITDHFLVDNVVHHHTIQYAKEGSAEWEKFISEKRPLSSKVKKYYLETRRFPIPIFSGSINKWTRRSHHPIREEQVK